MVFLFLACGRENNSVESQDNKRSNPVLIPESKSGSATAVPVPVNQNLRIKIPAGKPGISLSGSNVLECSSLPESEVLAPDTHKTGTKDFRMPVSIPLKRIPVPVKDPEVIPAGNMSAKDQNPASFSYYGKLQGMHLLVKCMLEDKRGNLWFGTLGGGITCYNGKNFTHFNEKSGLFDNRIQCMAEDRKGNLWIGTNTGAMMYDGKQFLNFSAEAGFPETLVQSICEDKKGNIWFGTFSGAFRYDGKNLSLFSEKEGLSSNTVNCVLEDNQGRIWFGTDGGGISVYDGNKFLVYSTRQGLSSDYIISLMEDKGGKLWVGTSDQGAFCIEGNTTSRISSREGLSGDKVWSICKDKAGSIWFGTESDGLTRYDGKNCVQFREEDGLSNNEVHDIMLDRHGNLWIATFGGVNKYQGNAFNHYTEKEGLGNNRVNGIIQDKDGVLWFGTSGGGLTAFNGKVFRRFTEKEGLTDNSINCLLKDSKNNLWIGTQGSGLLYFDGNKFTCLTEEDGLQNNSISCLAEDSSGNLWIGTNGGGASRFNGKFMTNFTLKEGLSSNEVNCILVDKNNHTWFGTSGGGISRFDGKKFSHFNKQNGLSQNEVFCLMQDKDGNLWAGTGGGGISVFHQGQIFRLGTENGLSNNFVFSLIQDRTGDIWIGTRNGLNKLNVNKITKRNLSSSGEFLFRNYGYEDGFLGLGCNLNALFEDRDGTIWVGGNDRLTAVRPEGLSEDLSPPIMEITTLNLFNEKVNWSLWQQNKDTTQQLKNGIALKNVVFDSLSRWTKIPDNLSLAYNNNNISFQFAGITSNRPKKIRYRYLLEGMDDIWSPMTANSEISFSNLPFGQYTLRIQAMNGDGIRSNELLYPFGIRPPWWRTIWAYLGYTLFAFTSFTGFIKWRERLLKDRQKELEREIARATTEIRNQNEVIEDERKRSDALLTNILPEKIAEELKVKGTADARLHEAVSVLFTDFSDFTGISAGMSPDELVKDLHECFSEFDFIVQKHGLEKIKVIGDSYMAASGIPDSRPAHAKDCTLAALEILDYFQSRRKSILDSGRRYYDLRIGIHSGPVVAGVVGFRKFQYDIWGDTVNTASRMESSGVPGRINISEETHRLIQDEFTCEFRGELEAKGKGKIRMYFVNGTR